MREEHRSFILLNNVYSLGSFKVSFYLVIISLKFILATSLSFPHHVLHFSFQKRAGFLTLHPCA